MGTALTTLTGQDDREQGLDLSFAFPFLGTTYSTIFVSTNGYVNLGTDASLTCCPTELSLFNSSAPVISPFWSDLDLNEMGEVLFKDFGNRAVVTWNAIGTFQNEQAPLTFQLELRADGTITFSYNGISDILNLDEDLVVGFSQGGGAANPGETDFSASSSFSAGRAAPSSRCSARTASRSTSTSRASRFRLLL